MNFGCCIRDTGIADRDNRGGAMNQRGVTLIELLVVIVIIGVLAAIAVPGYIGQQRNATRTEAYSNLEALRLLEEQFFAENGRYTASKGAAGNTPAIREANLTAIRTTAPDTLPRFLPGAGTNFSYRIIQNFQLVTPVANPPATVASAVGTPCFVAVATGVNPSRVAGEVFMIDCFNNRNF